MDWDPGYPRVVRDNGMGEITLIRWEKKGTGGPWIPWCHKSCQEVSRRSSRIWWSTILNRYIKKSKRRKLGVVDCWINIRKQRG